MTLEDRVAELETRQAFQDDSLQALNDVIFAQQQELERLKAQVQALASRQAELLGQLGGEELGEEPPPPHY